MRSARRIAGNARTCNAQAYERKTCGARRRRATQRIARTLAVLYPGARDLSSSEIIKWARHIPHVAATLPAGRRPVGGPCARHASHAAWLPCCLPHATCCRRPLAPNGTPPAAHIAPLGGERDSCHVTDRRDSCPCDVCARSASCRARTDESDATPVTRRPTAPARSAATWRPQGPRSLRGVSPPPRRVARIAARIPGNFRKRPERSLCAHRLARAAAVLAGAHRLLAHIPSQGKYLRSARAVLTVVRTGRPGRHFVAGRRACHLQTIARPRHAHALREPVQLGERGGRGRGGLSKERARGYELSETWVRFWSRTGS
jgi:hypothetical protein